VILRPRRYPGKIDKGGHIETFRFFVPEPLMYAQAPAQFTAFLALRGHQQPIGATRAAGSVKSIVLEVKNRNPAEARARINEPFAERQNRSRPGSHTVRANHDA
jgi:hypothetical protein